MTFDSVGGSVLRKAAEQTVEGLWSAIGKTLERFTPRDPQTTSRPQATNQPERKRL
jgi:hypothetical protein